MTVVDPTTNLCVRPYTAADQAAVLALANADRLPGRPAATAEMLEQALAGKCSVGPADWARFDRPQTDVIVSSAGLVVGAISYTVHCGDGSGMLLWWYDRDDHESGRLLLAHALARLGSRSVAAFHIACPLSYGPGGLPARHRPAADSALRDAGFSSIRVRRYFHRRLDGLQPASYPLAAVTESASPPGWRLHLRVTDGTTIGEAAVGHPIAGTAPLWWLRTAPVHRHRRHVHQLLHQCCTQVAAHGAQEISAYIDVADHHMAWLYEQADFQEIDHLHAYRTRKP